MRISVIIPCFNAEATLAQTIRSALNQTMTPAEVIVVDDGSSDFSVGCAARFAAPVRLLPLPRQGANAARNAGAAAASGDALLFLDADDLLAPTALEELAAALHRAPDGIAACEWRRYAFANGVWRSRAASYARRGAFESALSAWLRGWRHPSCAVLWTRRAFLDVGGWDETLEDDDPVLRAIAADTPLAVTDRTLAYYRRPAKGRLPATAAPPERARLEGRIRLLGKIAEAIDAKPRLAQPRQSLACAFEALAENCIAYPDLLRRCRSYAHQYGGENWRRELWSKLHAMSVTGAMLHRRLQQATAKRPPLAGRHLEERVDTRPTVERMPSRPCCVSVVIPTYNCGDVLPRALESVLRQTFQDIEVLIVDDGSTDRTPALMSHYYGPHIRYLRQPRNFGVAAARNRGMQEARGEFIAFLDADDEWRREKLMLQVGQFHRSSPRVGLMYTGVETIEGERRTVQTPHHRGYLYPDMLRRNVIHGTSGVMIRREVVDIVGGFDESWPVSQDYEYWMRVSEFYFVDYVPEALTVYYNPPAETRLQRLSRNFAGYMKARQLLYDWRLQDMRAAGAEHAFLISSARRELNAEQGSPRAAWRYAMGAIAARPLSLRPYALAALSAAPAVLRSSVRRWRQKSRLPTRAPAPAAAPRPA